MSKSANELIRRLEEETGQRIDEPGSAAMAGLFGAMSRLLGQSPSAYRERDDVVAGLVIQNQLSSEYRRKQQADKLLADLIAGGMSPDDAAALLGK